jgi:4-cresol dehydrogenase (hydroxylating)
MEAEMRLPQGVSSADFSSALQEFANVVGKEWVFSSDEDMLMYRDSFTVFFGEPDLELIPGAAVGPATVEEVQGIVRVANKYKVPIYAFSTGRNLGYGGSSPTSSGQVAVDLRRMRRILEINQEEGYALVEPGINWIEVYRYFHENNIPWVLQGAAMPAWGSPIGNAMDHGQDSFQHVYGVEVVLPTGEVLRTGMGALPTSKMWHNYYGYGPDISRMFAQSNFGIVTKAGFWLAPAAQPEDKRHGFVVTSFKTEDMQPIIDVLSNLQLRGIINSWNIDSPIRESTSSNDGRHPWGPPEVKALNRRRDGGSSAEWEKIGRDHNIAVVSGFGSKNGPDSIGKETIEYCRQVFASKLPQVNFQEGQGGPPGGPIATGGRGGAGGGGVSRVPKVDFGILAIQPANHGHNYFSPAYKTNAKDIFEINDTIRNVMLDAGDLDMLDNFAWHGEAGSNGDRKAGVMLMEITVHDDVALNSRRRELFKKMIQACGEKGWIVYRASTAFADLVMDQYSFNNHVLRRFLETIKDAVDPNGILAPGARGIWPKHLRKAERT